MEIRYFNSWRRMHSVALEAKLLITMRLLAEELVVGGETALALLIDKSKGKFSTQEKINIAYALSISEGVNESVQIMKEPLENYMNHMKSGITKFANDRMLFVAFKKLEKSLLNAAESLVQDYVSSTANSTFPIVRQMNEVFPIVTGLDILSRTKATNKAHNPTKEAKEILDFIFAKNPRGNNSILAVDPLWVMDLLKQALEKSEISIKNGEPDFEKPATMETYLDIYDSTPNFMENWFNLLQLPPINHLTALEIIQLKKIYSNQLLHLMTQ